VKGLWCPGKQGNYSGWCCSCVFSGFGVDKGFTQQVSDLNLCIFAFVWLDVVRFHSQGLWIGTAICQVSRGNFPCIGLSGRPSGVSMLEH